MMVVTSAQINCPINGNITIRFQTDAEDRYFDEHMGLGEAEYSHDIVQRSKLRIGIYTLTLKPSLGIDDLEVGKIINFNFMIKEKKNERFSFDIPIKITEALQEPEKPDETEETTETDDITPRGPNKPFTRKEKIDPNSKQNRSLIDRPDFTPISKETDPTFWEELFEGNDRKGANTEIDSNGRLVNIRVNVSHPSLLQYQVRNPDLTTKQLIVRYVNFIGFYTWALFLNVQSKKIQYPENYDIKDLMEATSDALALLGLGYGDASK